MGAYSSNGQQYAATADLYTVIAATALTHPAVASTATQNAALLRASELARDDDAAGRLAPPVERPVG